MNELKPKKRFKKVTGTVTSHTKPEKLRTMSDKVLFTQAYLDSNYGHIPLVIWGEIGKKVKDGDKIILENGYTNIYQGQKQISIGKKGKITIKRKGRTISEDQANYKRRH